MSMPNVIEKPYVIFVGDETSPVYTKTGSGIAHWDRESCVGQIRLSAEAADLHELGRFPKSRADSSWVMRSPV